MAVELNKLSLLAINASIIAGLEIMKIYDADNIEVEHKNDDSPLTKADTNANKVILEKLSSSGIPYITEESAAMNYEERKEWEYCWVIDPLDGTKEFIKRNGEFTVNIALIKNCLLYTSPSPRDRG